MTAEVSTSRRYASAADPDLARRRLAIGFMNWAHALDHFVILIYPTVVIELAVIYGRTYASLIALSTASFVAFGLFSLPAGWLADRWSRRNMMVGFYVGCGLSLIGARAGAVAGRLRHRAVHARRVRGDLSSGRHRDDSRKRHPARPHLAFNGVCGNLGVSLAAGITAALTAAFTWRGAFLVPGLICVATGAIYFWFVPDENGARRGAQHLARRVAVRDLRGDDRSASSSWSRSAPGWFSTPFRSRCRKSSTSASATASRWSRSAA